MANWTQPVYGTSRRSGYDYAPLALGVMCLVTLGIAVAISRYCWGIAESAAAPTYDFAQIREMLAQFRHDAGRYPSTDEGLTVLVNPPSETSNWRGPYAQQLPRDPWGHEYRYECPKPEQPNTYMLISYGSDGVAGGEGDAADQISRAAIAQVSE